jgi:hypothetical protein
MEKRKFWVFQRGDPKEETILRLDGPIAKESWFGDEVTPALFLSELESHPGDMTVWINSPGGDVFAASQIYTMLMFLTKSSIDKLRTSRIRAGAFRFPWHKTPPAIKKPAATPQVSIFFPSLIVSGSFVTFQFQIVSTRLKHSHLEKDLHKPGPVLPFAQDSQSPFALNDRG